MSIREVESLVGPPMLVVTQEWSEMWVYYPDRDTDPTNPPAKGFTAYDIQGGPPILVFGEKSVVRYVASNYLSQELMGLTRREVIDTIGKPRWRRIDTHEIVFHYSEADRTNGNGTYLRREIRFDRSNQVFSVTRAISYD
jgi:hypothetical protein